MRPQQSSRIDLADLKAQIANRLGPDKSMSYFYYLSKFLGGKLTRNDFIELCRRELGREILPLHNHLLRSILKNACQAKTPPPMHDSGRSKCAIQIAKSSPTMEDGHEHSRSSVPSQHQNVSIWSNGVIPVSPKKGRSGIRDRKLRDRPSPLGPNGKVECVSHQSTGAEDFGWKTKMENGDIIPIDYQRPVQHLQAVAEQPGYERQVSIKPPTEKARVDVDDGEEVEQFNHLKFFKSPLLAPLGIPYCSASIGGASKAAPLGGTGNSLSYYDDGRLSDTETLRKRMEQIAVAQGLGGVSIECANMLNNMLDKYMKQLITSCIKLVEARTPHDPKKHPVQKQQIQGKLINGLFLGNHQHIQNNSGSMSTVEEQKSPRSISMLDFKVAMELNPQQLGEDWPLLLEKICMQSFEE